MIKAAILKPTIDDLRNAVKNGSYIHIKWQRDGEIMLLDTFSASAIVKVYDAVKPENKEKVARAINNSKSSFMKLHTMVMNVL